MWAELRRLVAALRRVAGMPDYAAYVEHQRRMHPGCPVQSERDFFADYVARRYDGGGSRCC